MKLFIGITPPPEISESIQAFQAKPEFKKAIQAPRNSPPHVTLVRPYQINETKGYINLVKEAAAACGPIEIELGCISSFHNHIIYLEVKAPKIERLHQVLQAALGKSERRPYVPHLTLGRLRHRQENIPTLNLDSKFTALEIQIFGRELENTPYKVIKTIPLNGSY